MNLRLLSICITFTAFGLPWSAGAAAAPSATSPENPPNVVVLLADDLGYGELGCQGNGEIPTPHIDSIAGNGVRFTAGYVTAPVCSPSRAGLLSGRYQARFGYHTNVMPHTVEGSDDGIPGSETTLAEYLRESGYRTGLIGKWHLGSRKDYHPLNHGFDYFFGFAHEGRYYVRPPYDGVTTLMRKKPLPEGAKENRWTSPDGKLIFHDLLGNEPLYDLNNPVLRGYDVVEETRYLTDAFTGEALQFIDRNADGPFFLCLAYNAVHSPMQGADAYMEKMAHISDVQRRIFAAMLVNMDESVGAVLEKLRASGLEERTLVFFLSDNGGPTVELTSGNLPLSGGKGQFYEGGIRVPFLAQWKGKIPGGAVYEEPVISLDIYATAAAAAGRPVNGDRCDGVDLMPYLTGERKGRPHQVLFWSWQRGGALRAGDWKLLKSRGKHEWQLFNLGSDLSETRDLAGEEPETFASLLSTWTEMMAQMPPAE